MNPLDSLATTASNKPLIEALGELHEFCQHRNSRWFTIKPVEQVFVNIFDDCTIQVTDGKIQSFTESNCNTFEEFVLGVVDPKFDYTFYELNKYDIKVLFDKYKDLLV